MKLFISAACALAAMLWCSALAYADSLAITPTTLAAAQVGDAYSATLTAFPTTAGSYTWTAIQLPAWLQLAQDGSNQATLAGTPTQVGASGFTIQVTDSNSDSPGNVTYSLMINKGQPQIVWDPSPSEISFGTGLSGAQLNASATDQSATPLTGSFVYQPPANAILNAGTQTVTTLFTPTDTTNYATATAQTTITIDAADTSVALNDVTRTFGRASVQLTAAVTYLVNAAQRPVSGGTVTFVVSNGSGQVGNQQNASVSVGVASASFLISGLPPGPYTYTATYTPPSSGGDFNGSTQTANLTINQATPQVLWQPASPVRYNVPVTSAQLNASSSLPGTFAYTDASNAPVVAGTYAFSATGSQQLNATFTPNDTTDYASRTVTRSIQVLPDGTHVSATDSSGNALAPAVWTAQFGDASVTLTAKVSVTTPNAQATIPSDGSVTFTVSNASGVVGSVSQAVDNTGLASASFSLISVHAGTYHVAAVYSQSTLFARSSAAGTLLITKLTPTLTWTAPASIAYGTPLSSTQLDAAASVVGSFAYGPSAGTILKVGTGQLLKVLFRPTDATDYTSAGTSVTIDVTPAPTNLFVQSKAPPQGATSVTLVALVTARTTVNGGTVSFIVTDSGNNQVKSASTTVSLGSAKAASSIANLPPGSYTISATYLGSTLYLGSGPSSGTLTIS